ncbi:MAG: peptidylprolyl isomerase [Proteobacteria bacterium]|nr:peptidylprolyl isomerase [Pseudomonadota bacterium]MDA1308361.1 peptidylprolyl isomerase [Pseudomonadota bacterium]
MRRAVCRLSGYSAMLAVLASMLFGGPALAQRVGEAETVVGSVYGQSIGKTMKTGAAINFRQKMRVGDNSAAGVLFIDDTRLSLGARTTIVIDEFVYKPDRGVVRGSINLVRGFMRFASKKGVGALKIKTPIGSIGIRGTVFDALATANGLEVAVHEGSVQVSGPSGSQAVVQTVRAGEVLRLDGGGRLERSDSPSQEMAAGVAALSASFAKAGRRLKSQPLYANLQRNKRKPGAKAKPANRAPDNVLALDLKSGRVLIELLGELAPNHVARIKALAAKGFYDGLSFFSVKSDFAAITGDPTDTGKGGSGWKIVGEFSRTPFVAGSVGMIRDRNDPNSADSQFFIAYKDLPQLAGKYTKWGRVFSGMEHVRGLAQGRPPRVADKIISLRLLSQAP